MHVARCHFSSLNIMLPSKSTFVHSQISKRYPHQTSKLAIVVSIMGTLSQDIDCELIDLAGTKDDHERVFTDSCDQFLETVCSLFPHLAMLKQHTGRYLDASSSIVRAAVLLLAASQDDSFLRRSQPRPTWRRRELLAITDGTSCCQQVQGWHPSRILQS